MRLREKRRIIFLIIILIIFGYTQGNRLIKYFYPINYSDIILKYSEEYSIDPYLILALIKVESNFNQKALSKKNAIGLMQIRGSTGEWIAEKISMDNFDEKMLYEPEINIKMGCWYLDYLTKYYEGNLQLVLSAYNGGQGNVNKWLKDGELSDDGCSLKKIPFKETHHYLRKIKRNYFIYKSIYGKAYIKLMKGMNMVG